MRGLISFQVVKEILDIVQSVFCMATTEGVMQNCTRVIHFFLNSDFPGHAQVVCKAIVKEVIEQMDKLMADMVRDKQ